MEVSDSTNERICQRDLLSNAELKGVELKNVVVNRDKAELEGISVASEGGSAIAPTNITESELVPRVIVTAYAQEVIATDSVPQEQESEPQLPKNVSPPVPPPAKSQPVVPKKLTQTELDAVEDELKRLKINPDSCISVIKKYWENVGGAIARVKEGIQQGWCSNATGLFIASCKKGAKPEKRVVENEVNRWFNWARSNRIVIAMTNGYAYTPEVEAVDLREMMHLHPIL